MKKIVLSIIVCLPFLFLGCKKDKDNAPSTSTPQASVVLINISDSTTYTIFGTLLPDKALMLPGGTVKTYTINSQHYLSVYLAKQGIVDTTYGIIPSVFENTENIFILSDGRYVHCKSNVTTCSSPPKDNAIIRYINVDGFMKMEVVDAKNAVAASFNETHWPTGFGIDTVINTSGTFCTAVANGSYTLNIYADDAPTVVAYTKTNVQIDKNKVYYVYLDSKKEIKVIER